MRCGFTVAVLCFSKPSSRLLHRYKKAPEDGNGKPAPPRVQAKLVWPADVDMCV